MLISELQRSYYGFCIFKQCPVICGALINPESLAKRSRMPESFAQKLAFLCVLKSFSYAAEKQTPSACLKLQEKDFQLVITVVNWLAVNPNCMQQVASLLLVPNLKLLWNLFRNLVNLHLLFRDTGSIQLVYLTNKSQNMPRKAAHIWKNVPLMRSFLLCMELWKVHLILQDKNNQQKSWGKVKNWVQTVRSRLHLTEERTIYPVGRAELSWSWWIAS